MSSQKQSPRTMSAGMNKSMLSKSILQMKFMKRTKEKVEQQLYKEEGEEYFSASRNQLRKTSDKIFLEPSYVPCEDLIEGRLSFRGVNPEIEKLMELDFKPKVETRVEVDISNEEMAKHYKSNMAYHTKDKAVSGRVKSFRKFESGLEGTPKKKLKFLKPED